MSNAADNPTPTESAAPKTKTMDDIVALCRRRGFIWQSSEIYGGINGFWDYGPMGAALKKNLKDAWRKDIILCPPDGPDGKPIDIVEVDCTIIMHPKVWIASGHAAGFNDPMVDCTETKKRFRADKAWVVGFWSGRDHARLDVAVKGILGSHAKIVSVYNSIGVNTTADISTHLRHLEIAYRGILPALTDPDFDPEVKQAAQELMARLMSEEVDDAPGVLIGREAMSLQTQKENLQGMWFKLAMPTVMMAVEADSVAQAIEVAQSKLTKAQIRLIDTNIPPDARNQVDIYPFWPRISPATQRPTLTEPRQFNLMFETYCGAVKDEDSKAWLRPETAQGIFTQFWNVVDTSRVKVPFGIAQQGKAFRNEVTPRNFTFRSREFEQMEIEFFITHPDALKPGELTPVEWYQYWRKSRYEWWQSVGLAGDNLQLREHDKDELSHYAKEGAGVCDVEYRFPFTAPGFGELEGIAHRADFDLKAHARHANTGPDGKVNEDKANKLRYFDQERNTRYFPHVIEPSAGADRGTLALLCEAYTPDPARPSGVYMKFTPRMAPIKAGIFPLVNKDGMPEVAEKLHKELRGKYAIEFDPKQTIGKRYARMDEAGTPYCFTIDGDTLKDQTVTVRERDTLKQERINIGQVAAFLAEKIDT